MRGRGDGHTFAVVVTGGFRPLTYTWEKDGVLLDASGATLAMSSLDWRDAGTYRVTVSDGYTVLASTGVLTIAGGTPTVGLAGLVLLAALVAGLAFARGSRIKG